MQSADEQDTDASITRARALSGRAVPAQRVNEIAFQKLFEENIFPGAQHKPSHSTAWTVAATHVL